MKKMNNKGFAISTMVYGLLVLAALIFFLILSTMSTNIKSSNDFSDKIEEELNNPKPNDNAATVETCSFTSKTFEYDVANGGSIQEFTVPCDGTYTLEVWGAQGGTYANNNIGGYGGYSFEQVKLTAQETLYIVVGQQGGNVPYATPTPGIGGYNGGGKGGQGRKGSFSRQAAGPGGGGATHIATTSGLLKDLSPSKDKILIVAGGGGGAGGYGSGGSGGGSKGVSVSSLKNKTSKILDNLGGTQTEGYLFGQGQDGRSTEVSGGGGEEGNGGGGGGWYGGRTIQETGASTDSPASGGSGYVSETNGKMYCYKCEEDTITTSVESLSSTAIANTPKTENGYAKITLAD